MYNKKFLFASLMILIIGCSTTKTKKNDTGLKKESKVISPTKEDRRIIEKTNYYRNGNKILEIQKKYEENDSGIFDKEPTFVHQKVLIKNETVLQFTKYKQITEFCHASSLNNISLTFAFNKGSLSGISVEDKQSNRMEIFKVKKGILIPISEEDVLKSLENELERIEYNNKKSER